MPRNYNIRVFFFFLRHCHRRNAQFSRVSAAAAADVFVIVSAGDRLTQSSWNGNDARPKWSEVRRVSRKADRVPKWSRIVMMRNDVWTSWNVTRVDRWTCKRIRKPLSEKLEQKQSSGFASCYDPSVLRGPLRFTRAEVSKKVGALWTSVAGYRVTTMWPSRHINHWAFLAKRPCVLCAFCVRNFLFQFKNSFFKVQTSSKNEFLTS